MIFNRGMCGRHHDLAAMISQEMAARRRVSLFKAVPRSFPYTLDI